MVLSASTRYYTPVSLLGSLTLAMPASYGHNSGRIDAKRFASVLSDRYTHKMHLVYVGYLGFRPEAGTGYHLSVALARHMPVSYVNPPLSLKRWLELRARWSQMPDVQLSVLSVVVPGEFRFLPRRWRQRPLDWWMTPWLARRLRQYPRETLILWMSHIGLARHLRRVLRPRLACYHRVDDFGAMDNAQKPLEQALEEDADLIFAVSPNLVAQHRQRGRDAILLPNGVDIGLFSQAIEGELLVPEDLACIPHPRVGFIGWLIPYWIDIELMLEIARMRPDWSLVLIGPKVAWEPPLLPPNVHLLGFRPYHQLPNYLKGLDVCLVPFKDNAITHGASPLKLYEYLAAGRAVVSTPVPDLPTFGDLVWQAHTAQEFVRAIEDALASAHDPVLQQRRIEAVRPHSWEARAETVMYHLRQALGNAAGSVVPP
jgi:glycosyltransferase involved in cell wall biosynthesis